MVSKVLLGVNVAIVPSGLTEMVPAIGVDPFNIVKVELFIVSAFINLLN